jgi:hypothetical protein
VTGGFSLLALTLGFVVLLALAVFELVRTRGSAQARRRRQVGRQRRRGMRKGSMARTTGLAKRSSDRLS